MHRQLTGLSYRSSQPTSSNNATHSMEPHATISAKSLTEGHPDRCGFLRKRGQAERVLENLHLSRHINWRQRFVVIKDGCCYCFADETAKSPRQTFPLQSYNRIFRSSAERAAFVFTLEPAAPIRSKLHTFAASSEDDRKQWMKAFKAAMLEANSVTKVPEKSPEDEDDLYLDLEKPVFESTEIHSAEPDDDSEDDSSDDSDYDRPDEDIRRAAKPPLEGRRSLPLPPVPDDDRTSDRGLPKAEKPHQGSGSYAGATHNAKRRQPAPLPTPEPPPLEALPKTKRPPPEVTVKATASTPERPSRRLSEKDCLFDNSDRETAIGILREKKVPGTFLIRKSRQGDSKVLAVLTTEDVKEYKIFKESNQVSLDRRRYFDSVDDLLDTYTKTPLPNRQQTLGRSFSSSSSGSKPPH